MSRFSIGAISKIGTISKINTASKNSVHKGIACVASLLVLMCVPTLVSAAPDSAAGLLPAVTVTTNPAGGQNYSLTLQVLALMTALTFLPSIVIMMTSFTRIIVVLSILRQAIGLQQSPSNQILVGIALFMTFFIMSPVLDQINHNALQPYLDQKISTEQALDQAEQPLRRFMMAQTRVKDLRVFSDMANVKVDKAEDVPFRVLIPAFITSELKTAFQIGFMLFLPFLVIDLVISSVLMAMGMMMLSPMIISLPFKLMLFVLVDGWGLILGSLANSYGLGAG